MFCLLGGYGVTAESATVTYNALLTFFDESESVDEAELFEFLRRPLLYPDGQLRRYRFPGQRARRIAGALQQFRGGADEFDLPPLELRQRLLAFEGIGPKTASWIVRNVTGSDEVAIIDIWVVRALRAVGIFPTEWEPARHYQALESTFLQFATQAGVSAAALDLCIWEEARQLPASTYA